MLGSLESILLLLALFMPLAFSGLTQNPFVIKELFLGVSLFVSAALITIQIVRGKKFYVMVSVITAAVAAFTLYNIFLIFLSANPALSGEYSLGLGGYVLLFFLSSIVFAGQESVKRLVLVVAAAGGIVAVYGVMQYFGYDFIPWVDDFRIGEIATSERRVFSTLGHPNFLGAHLAMTLPFIWTIILNVENRVSKIVSAIIAGVVVVCLLLTFSRGAWVAAVVSNGIFFILLFREKLSSEQRSEKSLFKKKSFVTVPIIVLVVLAVTAPVLIGSKTVRQRFDISRIQDSATFKTRAIIWSGTMSMIREKPFLGFGPGTFKNYFPYYRDRELFKYHDDLVMIKHAHNEFLELFAETGVMGLFLYLVLLGSAVLGTYSILRNGFNEELKLYYIAVFSGIMALLVSNLFGVNLRLVNSGLFMWLLLGVIAAGYGSVKGRRNKKVNVYLASVIALFSLVILTQNVRLFMAETNLKRAEQSFLRRDYIQTVDQALQAASYRPTDTRALMLAGEAMFQRGEYPKAVDIYQKAARRNPSEPLLHYDMALTWFRMKRYDQGLKAIETSLKFHPAHPESLRLHADLLLGKGIELIRKGGEKAALSAFQRVVDLYPGNVKGHINLGNTLFMLERYDEATEAYTAALEIEPGNTTAQKNMRAVEKAKLKR